jgi:hypothetical protein
VGIQRESFDEDSMRKKQKDLSVGEAASVEIISQLKSLDERQLATRPVTNRRPDAPSRGSFSIPTCPQETAEKGGDN